MHIVRIATLRNYRSARANTKEPMSEPWNVRILKHEMPLLDKPKKVTYYKHKKRRLPESRLNPAAHCFRPVWVAILRSAGTPVNYAKEFAAQRIQAAIEIFSINATVSRWANENVKCVCTIC